MKKSVISVLLALLIVLAMLTGCAPAEKTDVPDDKAATDEQNKQETGTDTAEETEKKDEPTDNNDSPVEEDVKTLTWMGVESYMFADNFETAADWASRKNLDQLCLDNHNLVVDATVYSFDAYLSTFNGLMAAGTMLDSAYNWMSDSETNSAIKAGQLAAIDDILVYSDGTASGLFAEGAPLRFLKAWSTTEDGNWYNIRTLNSAGTSINLSTPDMNFRNSIIHGLYSVCIRQDWLNKLGMSMPETTDQFYEYLKECQAQDVNGNDVLDERIIMALGTDNVFGGVGQWFGLPQMSFIENPGTGEVEVPCLMEGYLPFCSYVKSFYDAGLVQVEGWGAWDYSTECTADECAAHYMMPKVIWYVETGDENADYEPMPIIQAVENIAPRIVAQEAQAAGGAFLFRHDCDYDAAARFIDYLHSEDWYMAFVYGVQGKAWDYDENGNFVKYTLSDDDKQYGSPSSLWLAGSYYPTVTAGNVYDPAMHVYNSCQEALDAGEPYAYEFLTKEEWQEQNNWDGISPVERMLQLAVAYGEDNLYPCAHYSYMTSPTDEESLVLDAYATDLTTYLLEMTTNFIVGRVSMDEYDTMLQYAYDNIGLQEYINVMQARYNRYLETMGLPIVPIE